MRAVKRRWPGTSLWVASLVVAAQATAAEPVSIGLSGGAVAWQKAASPAPLLLVQLSLDAPVSPRLSLGGELAGARVREENSVVQHTTWPLRASLTVDATLTRQTVNVRVGVGPALVLAPTQVHSDGASWGGLYIRPGLRLRGVLESPLSRRVGWRLQGGSVLRQTGLDWDVTAGLTVRFGGEE